MTIANRESFAAAQKRGPTARDYVQDGLVAMWDGVENAGWGKHTTDTSKFREVVANRTVLVGNYGDSIATAAAPWTVTDTGVRSNTVSTVQNVGIAVPYVTSIKSPWCIECVWTVHSRSVDNNANSSLLNYVPAGSAASASWHSCWQSRRSANIYVRVYYSGQIDTYGGINVGLNFFHYGRHPGTGADGTGSGSYNACGTVLNATAKSGNWNADYSPPSGSTHRVFCTGIGFDSTLHNYRIYNRKLSKEEIAYNKSIDEARFGS